MPTSQLTERADAAAAPNQPRQHSESSRLADEVAEAEAIVATQDSHALVARKSGRERRAEQRGARRQRGRQRRHQTRQDRARIRDERRTETHTRKLASGGTRDERWHASALQQRQRLTSPDARLARLARRSVLVKRFLIGLVVLGMTWAGINVQHNLVPSGNMADPLYWISYGVELLISGCLVVVMLTSATFSEFGRPLRRGSAIAVEAALLLVSAGLNSGPHLAAGNYGTALEYAIPSIMVGVILWLDGWTSARFGELLAEVAPSEHAGVGQLDGERHALVEHMRRVDELMADGALVRSQAEDGGGAPSASKIAKVLNVPQATAGQIRDGLKVWYVARDQA